MSPHPRFNVLLTEDRPHAGEQHWTVQLPRLLQPHGIEAYVVGNGRAALHLAGRVAIHAAVIDLGTPLGHGCDDDPIAGHVHGSAGGLWLLELLRRLPNQPPVVLLRKPASSRKQAERLLREALRLGAFSVLNKPVSLEEILTVFQRVVERRYRGAWPIKSDHA